MVSELSSGEGGGSVGKGCRLFKRCGNLPSMYCGVGVQAV